MADRSKLSKEELVAKARKGQLTKEEEFQYLTKVRGYSSKDARYHMQPKRQNTFNGTDIDFD